MKKPTSKLLFLVTEASYFFSHRYPLAKSAQQAGYDVSVATQENGAYIEHFKKEGFTVYPLKHLQRASLGPWNQLKTLHELYKLYRHVRPELVHHVAMKPVLYGTIIARLTGIPHVVNAITGLGFMFISPTLIARALRTLFTTLLKIFSRSNVYYILQNNDDQRLFARFIESKNCILIRGSGVNTDHFSPPKKTRLAPDSFTVGIPARLLWDKGIGEAIEAQKILKAGGVSVTLLLAGGLDPQNPSAISSTSITEWEQAGFARWVGKIDDMRTFLSKLDAVLLPSYREGLPLALLEAASMGLPIITTDVPGCREVIVDHKTGLLVPLKDPLAIADALTFFVNNRSLIKKWGLAGRAYVTENFSEEQVIEQTLKLYGKLFSTSY